MKTNIDISEDLHKLHVPLVGIYNKDKFPNVPRRNGAYVINLDDDTDSMGNDKSGTHWVGMFIEGKHAGYYDSFGFSPPRQVQDFLKPYRPYIINDKHIQNEASGVCGTYVIYFLWWMTNQTKLQFNQRFKAFVELFSDDTKKNRQILSDKIRPLKLDLYE